MQKVVIENGKVVSVSGHRGMGSLLADLSENNTKTDNTNNQKITKTDSNTNIKLEASSGTIPENTIMNITEITSGETFEKIKTTLEKIKNLKAFDITLKSDGKTIQPNGKVKISIPIPVDFDTSKLVIYRLDENKTKTEYQVTVVNGYATFETNHFSTYVLGEQEKLSNEIQNNAENNETETTAVNNNTKLPKTGEETNAFAKWLSIAIALGVFWIFSMLLIEREKKKIIKK